jgi:ABC-type bacteriocin/lantibiotic exporter with double-glycine peptidase domain
VWLRTNIGIVLQENYLFSGTIKENIALPRPNMPMEGIVQAAQIAGAHEFISKLPKGYDTEVGERGSSLSGGQKQRIAIARAILNRPKLIVADEPTGNLDLETAANIIQLLRQVTQMGTAVIMTTHNISLLSEYPGIVYRCIDGRLEDITETYNTMALYEDEESNDKAAVDYSAREDLSI